MGLSYALCAMRSEAPGSGHKQAFADHHRMGTAGAHPIMAQLWRFNEARPQRVRRVQACRHTRGPQVVAVVIVQRTRRARRAELDWRRMGCLLPSATFICKFNYKAQGLEKEISVDRLIGLNLFFFFLLRPKAGGGLTLHLSLCSFPQGCNLLNALSTDLKQLEGMTQQARPQLCMSRAGFPGQPGRFCGSQQFLVRKIWVQSVGLLQRRPLQTAAPVTQRPQEQPPSVRKPGMPSSEL